jgi:Ca-activated chloride channel family protein
MFADQAKAQRIPITTLGLGNDFDETMMTQIAQRSGGAFHFVDDASRVAKVFKEEISKMERLVAKSSWLEITPGPGVLVTEAVGMPVSPAGRSWRISLGDITEGQNRDVILRVKVTGKRDGQNLELMDSVLHYTPAEGGNEMLAKKFASLKTSSDAAILKDANVVDIDHQATRVVVADGIVRAVASARMGDLVGARKILVATQKLAVDGAKKFSDAELTAKAKEIDGLKKTIGSLAPPPPPVDRFGAVGPRPKLAAPMAASPKEAMSLRAAHGDAMREIQGE